MLDYLLFMIYSYALSWQDFQDKREATPAGRGTLEASTDSIGLSARRENCSLSRTKFYLELLDTLHDDC